MVLVYEKYDCRYGKANRNPFYHNIHIGDSCTECDGVKKVAVATPYIDEVTQLALAYLKENGIEVCNSRGMGLLLDRDIDAVKLDDVYEFAKNTDCEEAEALVVLCTGLRTIPTIERLERRLQKPVITAIQASMWNALRMVGIDDKVEGYGSLFER